MTARLMKTWRIITQNLGIAVLVFIPAACASSGGQRNPELIGPPDTYYGNTPVPLVLASNGISTAEAAALAIANSDELRSEYKSLALRKTAWLLGFSAYLPVVGVSAGTDERLSGYSQDSFAKTVSASIDQAIWNGGKLLAARLLMKAELSLAQAELDRKARDTGESAVSAYRAVLAARLRLGIQKDSLTAAQDQRRILAAELALGFANEIDLLEADIKLADMEIAVSDTNLSLTQAEAELMEALGVPELPELLERLPLDAGVPILDAAILADEAIKRSVELEIARHEIEKKRADLRVARLSWLPSIRLQAIAQASGTSFPLTRATWSLGLVIDFANPFLGGDAALHAGRELPYDRSASRSLNLKPLADPASITDSREAVIALKTAEELYESAVERLRRTVSLAIGRYAALGKKRDVASRALDLSNASLALTRVRVGLGQVIRSTLIEAELGCAERNIELVDSVSALISAERELEKMLDIPVGLFSVFAERTGAVREAEVVP